MRAVMAAGGPPGADEVVGRVADLAARWRAQRDDRRHRQALDPGDFLALVATGYLRLAVPVDHGGRWESPAASIRAVGDALRLLGGADPSVALVAAMHPSVLGFWLASPDAPEPHRSGWAEQRGRLFGLARDGAFFGTITSEPGSGGDVTRTATRARRAAGGGYRLSGDKHFGSGSGVCGRMLTTARPEGEDEPDGFVVDLGAGPWDGSAGCQLLAEWDGMGMIATQSHAMRFADLPAERFAWPGNLPALQGAAAPTALVSFTAVVSAVVAEAVATARARIEPRAGAMRPYEAVEWARAETEQWLVEQAYEGMVVAVEAGDPARALWVALRGKTACAELAESVLLRLTRVTGGGSFSRRSPLATWFEDVRALGFLRPPWGLAYDLLHATSFPEA